MTISAERMAAFEALPVDEQRSVLEALKLKKQIENQAPAMQSLGQAMQEVIPNPEYFRAGTSEIDCTDPSLSFDQRWEAFKNRDASKSGPQQSKPVRCPYCVDRKYVVISREWLIARHIPSDFDPSHYAYGYLPGSSFAGMASFDRALVACDCHSGHIGPDNQQKSICRFSDFFLEHISTSVYGERIRAYRQQRAHERERRAQ